MHTMSTMTATTTMTTVTTAHHGASGTAPTLTHRDLDALDRQLLGLLRANARTSVAELARTAGVTRTTVTKRLDRMERRGVIRGYTVLLAGSAEPEQVRAVCQLAVEGRSAEEVVASLRAIPAVTGLHSTNGEWDLVAELTCDQLSDIDMALALIRRIDGVRSSETSILLRDLLG